jgi:hypothetical protein
MRALTFGAFGFGVAMVLWFFLSAFFGGVFEAYWNGQTPGKRAMQIRVISIDGQPINGLQAVLRNILRAVDMQPAMFYMVGLLTAMMNNRFQRLGDLACGTMVVIEEPQWFHGRVRIAEPGALRLATLIPVDFQPSRPLARALATYVQRRSHFPWVRRIEDERAVDIFEMAADKSHHHVTHTKPRCRMPRFEKPFSHDPLLSSKNLP